MRYTVEKAETEGFPTTYVISLEAHDYEIEHARTWLAVHIARPLFAHVKGKFFIVHFLHDEDAVFFRLRFCEERIE